MSNNPSYAWLFDVDGVITHPEQKRITEPQIITEIIKRLQRGEPVALVTGRSVEFMWEKVIAPLKEEIDDNSLLQNFLAVGEKGGVMLSFDQSGNEVEQVDESISVPLEMQKEAKELVEHQYSDSVFFDTTKKTMISIEMKDGFDLATFTSVQKALDKDLEVVARKFDPEGKQFSLDATTIATDIQNRHVGKHFAAGHVLDWLQGKGIKPQNFIAIGDSPSDLEMAEEIYSRGLPVEFIFVGDPTKIRGQSRGFSVGTSNDRYEKGTLEFLTKDPASSN